VSILLIRHGETDLNATRVVQYSDTPLGENGHQQARQLAKRLSTFNISRILCSDYARAHSTAKHIMQHTQAEIVVVESLRERHFGDLRGQPYESLTGVDIFARDYYPPGGESWETFDKRVDQAWAEVVEHAGNVTEHLAVVTHGLVLRSLFDRHLDLNELTIEDELVVGNTALTQITSSPPWRVELLACVAHLEQVSVGGGAV
jgi:broad specificity phosphatase PhoE